jgi:uncharacterized protein (TIGR03437 family)
MRVAKVGLMGSLVGAILAQTPAPRISAGGVVGAGLSTPKVRQITPNAIVTVFGENFAPAGTARLVGQADLVDGKLPTSLAGVCVEVGGQRARLFHVFPGQINFQVPGVPTTGPAAVQVILNCGAAAEMKSNAEMATVQAVAPEFFFFVVRPDGRNPIAALDAQTGTLIGAPGLAELYPEPRPVFRPARPGQIVSFFATGLGRTDPAFDAGVLPDRIAPTAQPVVVTFNSFMGLMTPRIHYAGVAPGLAGLYQINVQIPDDAPDFDLQVTARIGNVATPAGAYLTVQRP